MNPDAVSNWGQPAAMRRLVTFWCAIRSFRALGRRDALFGELARGATLGDATARLHGQQGVWTKNPGAEKMARPRNDDWGMPRKR